MMWRLSTGVSIYAEEGWSEDADGLTLDPKKALWIVPQQGDRGMMQMGIQKLSDDPLCPTSVFIYRNDLSMRLDVHDKGILQQFRSTLSGLILATPDKLKAFK